MDLKKIMDMITKSSPQGDWERVCEENGYEFFYKPDVNLRIKQTNELKDSEEPFNESWLENLPNKEGRRTYISVYYNATRIAFLLLISIDGGRAVVPMPENANDLKITSLLALQVARIVSPVCDEYISLCKLTIEENYGG